MQVSSSNLPISYIVSGIEVVNAIQESVKTKTNICFVHDSDMNDNLLRVGYFLASRDNNKQVTPIKWFSEKTEVAVNRPQKENPGTGRLNVNFAHPKKHEKHFSVLFPVGEKDIRVRCIFRIEKDGTRNFVVMLDIKILNNSKYSWKQIIRYDCAHGYIHKDILTNNGKETLSKKALPTQDKLKAIRFIVDELLKDLRPSIKKSKISESQITIDLHKAERLMIKLFNPSKTVEQITSSMVAFSEMKSSPILIGKRS